MIKRHETIYAECLIVRVWMNVFDCLRDCNEVIKEHQKFKMIKVLGNNVEGGLKVGKDLRQFLKGEGMNQKL